MRLPALNEFADPIQCRMACLLAQRIQQRGVFECLMTRRGVAAFAVTRDEKRFEPGGQAREVETSRNHRGSTVGVSIEMCYFHKSARSALAQSEPPDLRLSTLPGHAGPLEWSAAEA